MRKIIVLVVCALAICGCEEEEKLPYTRLEVHRHCPESIRGDLDRFVLGCIENANPNSDEEPEDWIELCAEMGEKIHCEDRLYRQTYRPIGNYYQRQERILVEDVANDEG